jgi:hypothetical protein
MPKTRATTVTSATVSEIQAAKALLALKKTKDERPKRKCAVYKPGKYCEEEDV